MKECPICGAKAFADASVCFGCMHRFGEEPERVLPIAEPAGEERVGASADGTAAPSFLITFAPPAIAGEVGPWTCSVELVKGA